MKSSLKEYCKKVLSDHGCDEYTYGDEPVETILDDLKTAYPDGMDFPYVDVANAIKKISKPHMIERKPYRMVYETDSFVDGVDFDSFAAAKNDAIDTLVSWEMEESATWRTGEPTNEQMESWDYMIYNCGVCVKKYNPDTDTYDDYWEPNDRDLKEIGWLLMEELTAAEKTIKITKNGGAA